MSQTEIKIIDDLNITTTREATEPKWDRDGTRQEHYIRGIELVTKPNSYFDLTVSFDVLPDTTYYLVYVLYDTGDSFGHDENRIEFIDLYQSQEKALALKTFIEQDDIIYQTSEVRSKYSLTYKNEQGNEVQLSKVWVGYFENFNLCDVESVQLMP